MTFRHYSKKGQTMWHIVGMVLAVIVILIMAYIAYKQFKNTDDVVDGVCPGTCKKSCSILDGEVQKSTKCINADGELEKGMKCCFNAKDQPKNDGGSGGGTNDIPKGDVIEVRLNDDMSTKLGLEKPLVIMELGKTYKLSVWGFGPTGKTCQIKFLDEDGKVPKTGFLSGKGITQQECVDPDIKTNAYSPKRKNKYILIVNDITPKGGEVGNYKFNVYMYDKDGTQVASYPISIRVTTNSDDIPLADDFCKYTSCSEVPSGRCMTKNAGGVPNCPNLDCYLRLKTSELPEACLSR